jgi:hypothetical protein
MWNGYGKIYLQFGYSLRFPNKYYLTNQTSYVIRTDMNLLKRYLQGDTIGVYEEIDRMGSTAFKRNNLQEVNAVLTETMNRVNHNLGVIYSALQEINYCFKKDPHHDFEYPLLKPQLNTPIHIWRLENAVKALGYLPLSMKMFFRIVGACNFAWDYDSEPRIPWEGGDPIQIGPATDLLSEAKDLEPDDGPVGLPLAADYYIKDNISGGPCYSIELTVQPQVDSRFLNEEHNTTFVNYLRICLENCGFSRPYAVNHLPEFVEYCNKVNPLLKPI